MQRPSTGLRLDPSLCWGLGLAKLPVCRCGGSLAVRVWHSDMMCLPFLDVHCCRHSRVRRGHGCWKGH